MNIYISIDKVVYKCTRFLFFAFEVYQNKTGFEKGKATLSKSEYIMLDRGFGRLRGLRGLEIADSIAGVD